MKRTFLLILAILFPWVVLLINDDPVGAFLAMAMQVTVVGWIPASMWAWRSAKASLKTKKNISKDDETLES